MSETTTKLSVRMPASVHKRLKVAAIEHNTTVQDLTVAAIEKHLASLDA